MDHEHGRRFRSALGVALVALLAAAGLAQPAAAAGPSPAAEPTTCDRIVTGPHTGPLTVTAGVTCLLAGATVLGEVNVHAGAGLVATAAVVQGPVSAAGAGTVQLTYTQVTGPVLVAGVSRLGSLIGNQVTGSVVVSGSTTGEQPVVVSGNTIIGSLSCIGNQPAPTDNGLPNTATAGRFGQCAEGPAPVEITTTSLPRLHVLEEYEASLAAEHGTPPYTWSAEGLPAGLVLDESTGRITSDPAAPAITDLPAAPVTVTVTDAAGGTDRVELPLDAVVVERIAAGNRHACAVTSDTTVYCWGGNLSGQLGDGTIEDRLLPTPVVDPDDPDAAFTGAVEISARESHTCVTTVDGSAYCWGFNGAGRLGLGHEGSEVVPVPGRVVGPAGGDEYLTDLVSITAGGLHTCALTGGGVGYCWGDNFRGQLGYPEHSFGVPAPVSDPADPSQPLTGLRSIGAGGFHTCAVTTAGSGYCWGWNHVGQLGTGSTVPLQSSDPLPVVDPDDPGQALTGLDHVDGGTVHTCAGTAAGVGYCWGQNAAGQLGNGQAPANNALPSPVADPSAPEQPLDGLAQVGTGVLHSCAVTLEQTANCWGSNDTGQLGDGTTEESDLAVTVADPRDPEQPFGDVASLAYHGWQTCAVTAAGLAYCWGNNSSGQLGDGTTEHRQLPSPVHPGPRP